ncbi:MAG: YfhO family protein [Lachnospiraceae bacterium]|nr:YfhO family protein [Lachnospiraceae bacterium]
MKNLLKKINRIPVPAQMFLLAFLMYVICVLPVLIMHGGLFFYYGDYNVQQVPFYILAHRAVRSGAFFWHWGLDLGGSLIGDLAFYLTGSPFFWLTIPFPESVVPYLMPFLMALKYATGATLGYLYIRRFTRTDTAARTGALLYAFSGFNACNIVFNHFTDAVCFFPLLLMTFDDLCAAVSGKEKKGLFYPWLRFTLTVSMLAVINYFFFFGMVLFLLLYAVIRYCNRTYFPSLAKMFGMAFFAGVCGVMIVGFYLSLAYEGVSGNTRLSSMLTGYDLLVYNNPRMYPDFLKSMIMTPDIIGRGTLFYSGNVKNASLAFYLPMFGVAGIAAYFRMTRGMRDWVRRLLCACLVIALIPVLNAAFFMLNTTYYARWYYMPCLFGALATALAVERGRYADLKRGTVIQTALFLLMILVYFLPSKNDEGELVMFNMSDNPKYFMVDSIVTAVLTLLLILVVFLISTRRLRMTVLFIVTIASSIAMTMNVLGKGKSLISNNGMEMWQEQMLEVKPQLPAEGFYRTETDDTATNYEMVWGFPTVHCFLSTVPSEIFAFYDGAAGISRWVESELPIARHGLRALLSVRYYIWNSAIYNDGEFGKGEGVYGFDDIVYEDHGLTVFENKNFIPPGFTFDYFVRQSVFDAETKSSHDKLLVKALILADEDADKYGHLMEEMTADDLAVHISNTEFDALCRQRAESACVRFETDTDGFYARTAHLAKDSLVFFSVPNTKGFTMYVDGKETEIISADYGLMAVFVPKGTHEIEAVYRPVYLGAGRVISLAGVLIALGYGTVYNVQKKKKGAAYGHDHEPEDSGEARES